MIFISFIGFIGGALLGFIVYNHRLEVKKQNLSYGKRLFKTRNCVLKGCKNTTTYCDDCARIVVTKELNDEN